jgi:hypothetical protein
VNVPSGPRKPMRTGDPASLPDCMPGDRNDPGGQGAKRFCGA